MAPLTTLLAALCALCAASLLPLAEAAPTNTSDDTSFADTYVDEYGERRDVADSVGDPNESDSIQQDSTAAWQTEMVQGLYAQRKAEKEFIDKMVAGGEGLNAMVTNITGAFKILEDIRKQRGSQLIKAHFENEIKLLKASSQKILASLQPLLADKSTDSAALKSLKAQVTAIFSKGFRQQLKDESNLFTKQMKQIQQEHTKQTKSVRALFDLLNDWKQSFQTGLKKSEKKLDTIAQSWDLL